MGHVWHASFFIVVVIVVVVLLLLSLCYVYTICHSLFTHPLGMIGRLQMCVLRLWYFLDIFTFLQTTNINIFFSASANSFNKTITFSGDAAL